MLELWTLVLCPAPPISIRGPRVALRPPSSVRLAQLGALMHSAKSFRGAHDMRTLNPNHFVGARVSAPIAQWLRIRSRRQEVRGSSLALGGARVSQLHASGGISALQSRASGLRSTTQGNPIRTDDSSESNKPQNAWARGTRKNTYQSYPRRRLKQTTKNKY